MASPKVIPKYSVWFDRLDQLDIRTCLFFNGFCHRKLINQFFAVVSRLGDGMFWYALILTLPIIWNQFGMAVGLLALGSAGTCTILYKTIKSSWSRERPFIRSEKILQGCAPLDRYSFPSGHTMHAVCFATVILQFLPMLWWIVLPFTMLVALSRMVLGLHYPSDVIVGAVLGYGIGMAGINFVGLAFLI